MSKRLLGLLICLLVIALLVGAACALFIIGDVVVNTSANMQLTDEEISKIIQDSGIVKHSSIFGVDENIAIDNIESKNPTYHVITIERKFPNIVAINVTNRVPILAINISDGKIALLDRSLKVVKIVDSLNLNYITIVEGYTIDSVQEGAFINNISWLNDIIISAESLSFVNERFSTFFTKIELVEVNDMKKVYITTNTGVKFVLNVDSSIGLALNYAYTYYIKITSEDNRNSGYIYYNGTSYVWVQDLDL